MVLQVFYPNEYPSTRGVTRFTRVFTRVLRVLQDFTRSVTTLSYWNTPHTAIERPQWTMRFVSHFCIDICWFRDFFRSGFWCIYWPISGPIIGKCLVPLWAHICSHYWQIACPIMGPLLAPSLANFWPAGSAAGSTRPPARLGRRLGSARLQARPPDRPPARLGRRLGSAAGSARRPARPPARLGRQPPAPLPNFTEIYRNPPRYNAL